MFTRTALLLKVSNFLRLPVIEDPSRASMAGSFKDSSLNETTPKVPSAATLSILRAFSLGLMHVDKLRQPFRTECAAGRLPRSFSNLFTRSPTAPVILTQRLHHGRFLRDLGTALQAKDIGSYWRGSGPLHRQFASAPFLHMRFPALGVVHITIFIHEWADYYPDLTQEFLHRLIYWYSTSSLRYKSLRHLQDFNWDIPFHRSNVLNT